MTVIEKCTLDNIENFYEDIVNTIRESLLILDPDLRVIYANSSFYGQFKVTPKETEQKLIYELGNGQWNIPKLRELLEKILPKENVINGFEVEHDFAGIGRRTMLINARQVKETKSARSLILMVIEDITKEKKMIEYSIRTNRISAVGQLSAGIAHGLNSPLTGIQNFIKVYYDKEEKGSQKSKELDLMLKACVYMSELIKNLTHFVGNDKMQLNNISLISVVESALLFTGRQLTSNNIKVIKQFRKGLNHVKGNKGQLQHAVLNIILNAKEAMKEGGQITINAHNDDQSHSVVLEIIDDGIGIPKEVLSQVFVPFFTTKSQSGGAGLGLSAAHDIIKNHDGTIKVESEMGKGTKVIITLPATK